MISKIVLTILIISYYYRQFSQNVSLGFVIERLMPQRCTKNSFHMHRTTNRQQQQQLQQHRNISISLNENSNNDDDATSAGGTTYESSASFTKGLISSLTSLTNSIFQPPPTSSSSSSYRPIISKTTLATTSEKPPHTPHELLNRIQNEYNTNINLLDC